MKSCHRLCAHGALLAILATWLATSAIGVTTNWNTNNSGLFTAPANWSGGVPGTADTAQFNRGINVTYNVTFPGGSIIAPPPVYTNDRLIVRSNTVGFQRGTGVNGPSYVLTNTSIERSNQAVIIGQQTGDVAKLTTAILVSAPRLSIADAVGSTGELDVIGSEFDVTSNVNSSDSLIVGERGTGTLKVTSGARLSQTGQPPNVIVADLPGSTGGIVVDGVGSTLAIASLNFRIGLRGFGTLLITGGAHVESGGATIADFDGSGGAAVDGAGSMWNSSGGITVGQGGPGTLDITTGGVVHSVRGDVGSFSLADAGSGIVRVGGTGSKWMINEELLLGLDLTDTFKSGELHVTAGGKVECGGDFVVGTFSAGQLEIGSGGQVTAANMSISDRIFAKGTAVVDGAGSKLSLSGDLSIGQADVGSLTFSNGGAVSVGGIAFVGIAGTLAGKGVFTGDVVNRGVVDPGATAGLLQVDGYYIQSTTGRLQIDIGGTTPNTQIDRFQAGDITLHGTLKVSLTGGFIPAIGNTFDVLDWSSLSGTFDTFDLARLPGGPVWDTSQLYVNGTLSIGGILGDYNHNGVVDAADYVVWRDTFGQTFSGPAADGNQNGTVDAGDYIVWRSHFGQTAASGAELESAPEPSGAPLALVALFLLLLFS